MADVLAMLLGAFLFGVGSGAWAFGGQAGKAEAIVWMLVGIACLLVGMIAYLQEGRKGAP